MTERLLNNISSGLAALALACSACFGYAALDAFVQARIQGPPEISLNAPKYHWTIAPEVDPALVNTHVFFGACDLAPGLRCLLDVHADDQGRVRIPARWRRPAGNDGSTVVGAHLFGQNATLEPQAVVISGLAPKLKARLMAEMGVFSRDVHAPIETWRVFRDGAGLANCKEKCLLTLSEIAPSGRTANGALRALGWASFALGAAWLLLWALRDLGRRRFWRAARVALGRPGDTLLLPDR